MCNPYTASGEGSVITGSGDGSYAGVLTSQATQVVRDNSITGKSGSGVSLSPGSVALIERNIIMDNGEWGLNSKPVHRRLRSTTISQETDNAEWRKLAGRAMVPHCMLL